MRPIENIFTLLRERGIVNDNLSDYERMFILQGGCPMSDVPESSRFEDYSLFTVQRECACTEKLGCRKLSSTGVRDDMFNLEPDQTAKQQDWERSATIRRFQQLRAIRLGRSSWSRGRRTPESALWSLGPPPPS